MENFLTQNLVDQGYIGTTGSTPYQLSTADQITQLQYGAGFSFVGKLDGAASPSAVHINVNFDGTQNNGEFPALNEFQTNVWNISNLQKSISDIRNTIYQPGIGAQLVPSSTLDSNGNPAPGSSRSDFESLPWIAGSIGNATLAKAYQDLTERVASVLAENPNAEIALNISGFSRGGAQAVAFANLLNERGIPGLYEAGQVPVNSMVLYDPVSMTSGALNTTWPTNVQNALVMVALNEGRAIMPAMPVGADAIVIGIPGAHANIGGSYNAKGISPFMYPTSIN